MKTILIYSIIFLSLITSINSFSQTPNWTSIRETNINPNGSYNVDIFTNGYGNHIIIAETNVFKYYRMDVNGNKNIETTIENNQVSYSSISGDANNLYIVYRLSSSYNIKIKHSIDGGVNWSSSIPQISLSSESGYIESIVSNNRLNVTYAVSSLIKYKYWNGVSGIWSPELPVSLNETGKEPRITAYYDGTIDRVYFLWGRNTSHEGRWREYDAANNQWVNNPQTAFSFGSPFQIDYSSPRGIAVDANHIYSYYGYLYIGAFYPTMQCQQRLKSNNQLVYSTREMTVKTMNRFFSTTTTNNISHIAYYYSDWVEADNLEIGIVRNKHTGLGIDNDMVYVHNFNDDPPSTINISSSSNDVYVLWRDISHNNLRFIYDDQAPLAPQNLTVVKSANNHPLLSWTKNNEPDLLHYVIYKKAYEEAGYQYLTTTTTNSFEDLSETYPIPGGNGLSHYVHYKITAVDLHPYESPYSNEVSAKVGGAYLDKQTSGELGPQEYSLDQNYPNPFNPSTKISYSIKEEGLVTLKVYDVLGREMASLVNENKPAGVYEVEFNAANFPSGVYIFTLRAGGFTESRKMILSK